MESLSMATTKSELQKHATQKGNHQQHVKSIHDEGKSRCEYCDYRATQKDNIQQHVKSIPDGVKYSCD